MGRLLWQQTPEVEEAHSSPLLFSCQAAVCREAPTPIPELSR